MPSSHPKPIVVIGSLNADLVARVDEIPRPGETVLGSNFQTHPGGKGANQAIAAVRMQYPVSMIGKVGDDAYGTLLRDSLRTAGVIIDGVGVDGSVSTGVALIQVSAAGENSITVVPGANEQLRPEDVEQQLPLLRSAGMVLLQLETPLDTVEYALQLCRRESVPVLLDPAPAQTLPESIFRNATWITPNETEAAFFAGVDESAAATPAQLVAALRKKGANNIILKQGSKGAYLQTVDQEGLWIPSFPVHAIDTTAAGDTFNGAFASAMMRGESVSESARFACAAAALSVTREGAQPSMPTYEEVVRFMM